MFNYRSLVLLAIFSFLQWFSHAERAPATSKPLRSTILHYCSRNVYPGESDVYWHCVLQGNDSLGYVNHDAIHLDYSLDSTISSTTASFGCVLMRDGETEWVDVRCAFPLILDHPIQKDGHYRIVISDRFSSARVKQSAYASWIIDRTPPNTTITEIDSAASNGCKFVFAAIDDWPVYHFQCRLDGEYWYNCTSPETIETFTGQHTFEVRAVDQASNVDPTPDTHSWYHPITAPIFADSYDFDGRTILQDSYYGSDDDEDAPEEEPPVAFLISGYSPGFYGPEESSPDDQYRYTNHSEEIPEEESVSDVDSQTDDYYAHFYVPTESSPDGPDENITQAVPTVGDQSPDYYYLSPIPDEPDSSNDSMPGIGYNSQTGGADDNRTAQFNSTSSSESEKGGHRGIILLCIAIPALFVTLCGVTAYARIIQLRLRSSNLFS